MAKIKYGIKNVYYSVATLSTDGSASYATPVALPGAVSISLDAQGDNSHFNADNIVYWTSVANNGYQGDLELALIPDAFRKDVLGEALDANNILYENADAEPKHFALTFEFNGDDAQTRHVMYNCTASRPAVASSTKAESIEPQTETITITATSIYVAGINKNVVKSKCPSTQTTQYATWNSTIYQPVST